jgi:XapX domain-containing protein
MMITSSAGIVLGLLIGAACRWFDLPSPAPPHIVGALLVLLMTTGFVLADLFLKHA